MTGHALEVLEFERVLERVAGRASSEAGRRRLRALRPRHDVDEVRRELSRVALTMRIAHETPEWAPGPVPDAGATLGQLGVDGAVLEPAALHSIGVLLTTSEQVAARLDRLDGPAQELAPLRARLVADRDAVATIERTVDEEGHVLSSASRELRRIRDRLRGAQNRIVKRLESFLGSLPERFVVPDASVTIRDGRYVIPVRREGKGEVGGIVHDESQTGATLYMEPPVAIEATNQLRELEREEAREVHRVLSELTAELAPRREELRGAFDALVDFDTLHARARIAVSWKASPPVVNGAAPGPIELHEARHPLLIEAGDGPVVPYDLVLGEEERCLVVSGPNTGGKSVFLKATGLIAALAQSGVVPPVGAGTTLPVFGAFFADIGDEQSIARNLSTFSAHLANLRTLVESADERALVLIDEMGTGTDPAEGAALSRAVIDELVARGATTIVSSHLGELKQLDTEGSGIVNASLQFDPERMEPTYRLVKGRPGRSYGLAIARRLGFPDALIDRAESYRDGGAAQLEDLLERLEEREQEVERLVGELDVERTRTERLREDLESREETLEEAERTAEGRARADARQMLMEARAEVEAVISELRSAAEEGRELEEAARAARQRVEGAARRRESRGKGSGSRTGRGPSGSKTADAGEGSWVRIRATGAKGRVVERRGDRLLVEVGALRFEVAGSDVEEVDAPARSAPREKAGSWSGPTPGQARLEVDLRGMRVDDMDLELRRSLDQAVFEDLPELRIIHGMGTGALRKRVGEILKHDGRVRTFRMGEPREGGAGVTIASFRGES